MKKFAFVVFLLVLFSIPAFAGGDPGSGEVGGFWLGVNGLPGWQGYTSSYMSTLITPPFYNGEEGSQEFFAQPHADQFTECYWIGDGGVKLSAQAHSAPDANGDFVWQGKIDVGANDPRTSLSIDWSIENNSSPYTWFMSIYSIDTRHREFVKLVKPGDTDTFGTINVPISRLGYDVLASAYIATPVPEPGSLVALLSGLIGTVGFARRRRS